jgi:hypothetical protein
MASPPPPISLADLPSDLVRAVAEDAALDADRVGCFLDELLGRCGAAAEGRPPLRLPPDFLLELAAGLRLLAWEAGGLRCHREAGLPPAQQALRDAFRWLKPAAAAPETGDGPERLMPRVLALFIERLAWNGRVEWGADIALGEAEEDVLAEVVANFLWAHRHDLGNEDPTAKGTP